MSDIWSSIPKAPSPFSSQTVSPLTPYVQQVQQEQKKKSGLLQPVQWIFDLLQRGQYLTANIGEEIIKSVRDREPLGQAAKDALTGALEGITGKRKGDWQSILFGGKVEAGEEDYDFSGLFPDAKLPTWAKKVIGFAANVALDPTTYVSFGASSAARATAKEYATSTLQKFLTSLGDAEKAKAVITRGTKDVMKDLSGNLARKASEVYQAAFKEGLRTGGKVGGVGERAMKFMGKEMFAGERYPAALRVWDTLQESFAKSPVGNKVADAWWAVQNMPGVKDIRNMLGIRDPFGKYINELKIDNVKLREGIGRQLQYDTFQTLAKIPEEIRQQAIEAVSLADMITTIGKQPITADTLLKSDPALIQAFIGQMPDKELRDLATQSLLRIGKDPGSLTPYVNDLSNLTKDWAQTVNEAVKMGVLRDFDEKLNYLPNVYEGIRGNKPAQQGSWFAQRRKYSYIQSEAQETAYIQWMFGATPEQARKIVEEKGISVLKTDLSEMLMYRAQAQARLQARMGIMEDFKKLGVPRADVQNRLLSERLGRAPLTGLTEVPGKPFEGLLFPQEVADVLNKVNTYTQDPGLKTIRRAWNSFTGWWKGFVTMTTGFHVRNAVQNELTLAMKHGLESLAPSNKLDALCATIYALAKDNPKPLIETFIGKHEGAEALYRKTLAKRIGPLSIQELADEAAQKVISRTTHGFEAAGAMESAKGFSAKQLNPMIRGSVYAQGSRYVGEYLENGAKMQNFLMDFKKALGKGAGEVREDLGKYLPLEDLEKTTRYKDVDYAIQWAKDETRKWFFEYDDLTDFEKKYLRNIIPFYSWLRKNIPHQLSMIITDPSTYSLLPKAEDAISADFDIDPEMIPEWMRAAGAIPLAKDKEGNPIMWIPNLGYSDLNKIPMLFGGKGLLGLGGGTKPTMREAVDDIIGSAHPLLKQIVQQVPLKGYDIFYRKDLDYNAKAPYLLRYFTKVPFMMEVMDGVARAMGYEKGAGFVVDAEGMLRMNGKIAKLLEDNLPILRTIEKFVALGELTIPGLDQAIEKATGAKDTYEGLEKFFQVMSFFAGVKEKTVNLADIKKQLDAEFYELATELRKKTEAYTPAAQKRKVTAEKAASTKYRRVGL